MLQNSIVSTYGIKFLNPVSYSSRDFGWSYEYVDENRLGLVKTCLYKNILLFSLVFSNQTFIYKERKRLWVRSLYANITSFLYKTCTEF